MLMALRGWLSTVMLVSTITLSRLQDAVLTRVTRMRDVFNHRFSLDEHGTPRTWRPKDNIPLLARQARREAARVLALLVRRTSRTGNSAFA